MSAVLISKARRISELICVIREKTRPDLDGDQSYIQGVRTIGCPLLDALGAACTCLNLRARVEPSVEGVVALNTLDTFLAELEARLLGEGEDEHG